MPTRAICAASLCGALLIATSGCGGKPSPSGARQALTSLEQVIGGGSPSIDDILRQGDDLISLPKGDFTDDEWARRFALLRQADEEIVRLAAIDVDTAVTRAEEIAVVDAANLTPTVVTPEAAAEAKFMADLNEVTQEAIVEVACGLILDTLAPDEQPAELGEVTDIEQVADQAMTKMVAKTWRLDSFQYLVDWVTYAQSVGEDSEQFATAVGGYSPQVIQLVARPPVSRALLTYMRTCYSPPRLP